jgi:biotin/methionine sulfoxide reductase
MLEASRDAAVRVQKPAVREGWLRNREKPNAQAPQRGSDRFVEVSWDDALSLVADELQRVRTSYGNASIFGGSYGWSSAGRFHHAQSQIHRFLNQIGGYVAHKDSYSLGAGRVLMPYIVASMDDLIANHTSWDQIIEHTELFVSFGGVPEKSAQVSPGGAGTHVVASSLRAARERGVEFVNISPTRDGLDTGSMCQWMAIKPSTDTALMLALAHWLYQNDRHDKEFLTRYTVGFDRFAAYLSGETDGTPKDAAWAEGITGIPQNDIVSLARKMASKRTMLNVTWSLQRADYGEQPFWMIVTLACMLGQIGLPGGGFGVGYGSTNTQGSQAPLFPGPTLDQGRNPVPDFIPVARIADMLLNPGAPFQYKGAEHRYADIRLVYWAGGNPFHHHQDLNRLATAWQKPETIIVHESYWTPTAKFSDIVLPITTTFEREDIAYSKRERYMAYMSQIFDPMGEAKDDYTVFSLLAEKMGVSETFTEGRDSLQWLRKLYEESRTRAQSVQVSLPDFDTFREQGLLDLYTVKAPEPVIMLEGFRRDPENHPLKTASGKLEIFCEEIDSYKLSDCAGHATWIEPREWLAAEAEDQGWLHLLSDQPKTKLHSQLDHSGYSKAEKINGREPVHMHPTDAAARGLSPGDLVRLSNDRGACLGSVVVTENIRPGVIRQSTGAWFDPVPGDSSKPLEAHGNPNSLTRDQGTSALSQGCAAYSCLVRVERFTGDVPRVTAFEPPCIVENAEAAQPRN